MARVINSLMLDLNHNSGLKDPSNQAYCAIATLLAPITECRMKLNLSSLCLAALSKKRVCQFSFDK